MRRSITYAGTGRQLAAGADDTGVLLTARCRRSTTGAMHDLIACVFCGGMDPNADSLLLQAAIAGGITAPWMLRSRLRAMVDRLRGSRRSGEAHDLACPLPEADDADPPPNAR